MTDIATDSETELHYHYAVVREDLPRGVSHAQLLHAAGESAALLGRPLDPHTHAVILAARDEAHLLEIASRLAENGITHVLYREIDRPYFGSGTAIGVVPGPREQVRKLLADLKLLR